MAIFCLNRVTASAASRRCSFLAARSAQTGLRSSAEGEVSFSTQSKSPPSSVGEAKVSKLESGLLVATEDGASTSTVSISFPSGGSGSEMLDECGAAFANKLFAFKTSAGLSSIAILRALENGGAKPFTASTRHGATAGYTCAPENASALVGAVLSSTTSSFEKWDVREAATLSKAEAALATAKPEVVLNEAIYAASYGAQSSLGRPYFATCSDKSLVSFRERNYVLDGAVLTATGVDHDEFTAKVAQNISDIQAPKGSPAPVSSSTFIGAEVRMEMPSGGLAHVALSMKSPQGSPALLSVLKHCLELSGASSYVSPGVVGVYGSSPAENAGSLTDSLLSTISCSFPPEIIARAKALAKREALSDAEGGSKELAGLMASWALSSGSYSRDSVAAAYDAISEKDISGAIAEMKKTKFSLAAVGKISGVPYLGSISS